MCLLLDSFCFANIDIYTLDPYFAGSCVIIVVLTSFQHIQICIAFKDDASDQDDFVVVMLALLLLLAQYIRYVVPARDIIQCHLSKCGEIIRHI